MMQDARVRRPAATLALLHAAFWLATGASGSWIVGGQMAKPHSRPYMASIQRNGEHFCGGVLVQRRWVMTAAHCVIEWHSPNLRVVLGAHSLQAPEGSEQTFSIQKSFAHPHYSHDTLVNDIRLLKLNRPATLNQYVRRIRLPLANSDLPAGTQCQVIGWGDTTNYGTIPTTLMEANETVVGRDACNTTWAGQVHSCMVCAANPGSDLRGFCSGDSGGPLVCWNRAHGIVSFNSKTCGYGRTPDVYTRVSNYIPWARYVFRTF